MTEPSPELWAEYHDTRYRRVSRGLPLNPSPVEVRTRYIPTTAKDRGLPIHPLGRADAPFNDVVQNPVFLAYHGDRAAQGATDPLALQVADYLQKTGAYASRKSKEKIKWTH